MTELGCLFSFGFDCGYKNKYDLKNSYLINSLLQTCIHLCFGLSAVLKTYWVKKDVIKFAIADFQWKNLVVELILMHVCRSLHKIRLVQTAKMLIQHCWAQHVGLVRTLCWIVSSFSVSSKTSIFLKYDLLTAYLGLFWFATLVNEYKPVRVLIQKKFKM